MLYVINETKVDALVMGFRIKAHMVTYLRHARAFLMRPLFRSKYVLGQYKAFTDRVNADRYCDFFMKYRGLDAFGNRTAISPILLKYVKEIPDDITFFSARTVDGREVTKWAVAISLGCLTEGVVVTPEYAAGYYLAKGVKIGASPEHDAASKVVQGADVHPSVIPALSLSEIMSAEDEMAADREAADRESEDMAVETVSDKRSDPEVGQYINNNEARAEEETPLSDVGQYIAAEMAKDLAEQEGTEDESTGTETVPEPEAEANEAVHAVIEEEADEPSGDTGDGTDSAVPSDEEAKDEDNVL